MIDWSMRLVLAGLLAVGLGNTAAAQALSDHEAEAEAVLQRLRGEMMAEMQRAMAIGPTEAIDVCRHLAPEIEARIEADTGWEVRRVGLRVRNPENAANAEERSVLLGYEVRALAGQDPMQLRTVREVERNSVPSVHFMQSIPMFDVCEACHGEAVAPEVLAEIRRLYPKDDAIGYRVGDIRGAFSLYKPIAAASAGGTSALRTEWDEIVALSLPEQVTLSEDGKSGAPQTGRRLFEVNCKNCHSARNLASFVFRPDWTAQKGSLCAVLETHGATSGEQDCDIAAFLKVLSETATR